MDQKNPNKSKESSSVRDMDDLVEQSKIMEHMKTNQEVKKSGKTPDPDQHKEEKEK
ncbi:hypothetical protein [Metabacillus sp. 84]|uniref:hypothetical protein n=1 Tax=unclassified Metabacillus TaxID=2675274 RepID=UPI003CF36F3D